MTLICIGFLLIFVMVMLYHYRYLLYIKVVAKKVNASGGNVTIINAKIWTGDPQDPWKESMVVKDGKIVEFDTDKRVGKIIDAQGRLVIPGMYDSHTHPHVPFIMVSPLAPTLFHAETLDDVLNLLKDYVKKNSKDKYPRLFGWMPKIFSEGQKPHRKQLDEICSDRPVFLVEHSGHAFWANTKALEIAGVLEHDPDDMGSGTIHRDSDGLATGFLEETEYAGSSGLLMNTVFEMCPYTYWEQVSILHYILSEYAKFGVTSIWTKDGNSLVTKLYKRLLQENTLPVRSIVDMLYSPYSQMSDFDECKQLSDSLSVTSLAQGFLWSDCVKIMIDLPVARLPPGCIHTKTETLGEDVFGLIENYLAR